MTEESISLARRDQGPYLEIQVKSLRGYGYIFMPKASCSLAAERLIAVVLFHSNQPPLLYLIPTLEWSRPNALLVSRDYEGKKSKPEWGIQASARNQSLIDRYDFADVVARL